MLLGGGSSGGGGSMSLGIRLFLQDQFSGPVRQVQNSISGLKGEFAAFQENLRAARNASLAVAAVGSVALAGMGQAVKTGADFHYMMRGVEAVSEGTAEQMLKLSNLAVKLGRETMFFPRDIASGMRFMAMAGQDAETIYKTISASVDLAGATMTELGGKMGAADIMTNALKAFGWEADHSSRMADILTKATTSANVSLTDLGNSVRYVAATSRNLAIPVEDTIANLMSLGNAGIQATMGGTALENMYRYLANSMSSAATKKSMDAWKTLGLAPKQLLDAHGDFLPMVDILSKMRDGMEGLSSVDIQNVMRQIFGVRGQRAGATLLRNLEEVNKFRSMLVDPKQTMGTAAEKMDIMMDSVQGAIWRVASAFDGLKTAFTEVIGGPLMVMLRAFERTIGGLSNFIKTPVGKFFTTIGAGIIAVVTPIMLLRAAIATLAFAFKSFTVTTGGMAASIKFMTTQLFGLKMAQTTLPLPQIRPIPIRHQPPVAMLATGQTLKTGKRGRKYVTTPGTVGRRVTPNTVPAMAMRGAAVTTMTSAGRGMGLLASGLTRGLGILFGPWGFALMTLATIAPLIINAFSKNTKAIDENTAELRRQAPMSKNMRELYEILRGEKLEDVVQLMMLNLQDLVNENRLTREAIVTAIEKESMGDLVNLLQEGGQFNTWWGGGK